MKLSFPSYVRETYRRSICVALFLFTVGLTIFLWNHLAARLPDWPLWAFSFLLVIPLPGIHGLRTAINATGEELRPKEPLDWGSREFSLIVLPLTLPVFLPMLLVTHLRRKL